MKDTPGGQGEMETGRQEDEAGIGSSFSPFPAPPIPDSPQSWDDVDHLVERMGRLDMELAVLDADYSEQLYNLLGLYRDRVAALVEQRTAIEKTVQGFCEGRKAEFAKKRSRKLTYGKVSFRVSERVLVPKGKEQIVITTLIPLGLSACVRISKNLNREP